jgi:protein SOK2
MNSGPEMYYPSHMSTGQGPPPQTVTSPYAHPHSQQHQQQHPHQHPTPPLLQPGPGQYPPPQYGGQYSYPNALSPPTGPPAVSTPMGPGQPVLPLPGVNQASMAPSSYSPGFDTTGQIQPPGMKPRVTATLWEDEGSLCFQVEARGICVARREGKP